MLGHLLPAAKVWSWRGPWSQFFSVTGKWNRTSQRRKIMEGVETIHTKSLKKERHELGWEMPALSQILPCILVVLSCQIIYNAKSFWTINYRGGGGLIAGGEGVVNIQGCISRFSRVLYCRSTLELAHIPWEQKELGVASKHIRPCRWVEVLFHQGPVHTYWE